MKTYRNYKDSGVQWIGKVPSHWNMAKLKYDFHIYAGATPKTENPIYWDGDIIWITPADYKTSDKYVSQGKRTISKEGYQSCNTQIVPKGSLIFSKRAPIGTIAIAVNELCTNQGCLSCVPKDVSSTYFFYIISVSTEAFELLGYGATFKEISANDFANVKLPLPPLSEQQAIASYLDAKTKPIDDIIAKREKQIELLEEMKSAIISRAVTKGLNPEAQMKDSGIEWIGEVPEYWEVADLKRYAKISTGKTPSTKIDEYFENEEIVWFTPGDFPDCSIILNDSSRKIDKRAIKANEAFLYPKNSVFLVGIGGTLGKIGIFEEEASCNQQINVIVCNSDIIKNYVAYYLYSKKEILKVYSNAATLPILNQDKTGYIKIALPPLSEQQAIASYLDSETSKIDTRIAKRRKQIELLQEYKQALITAAVTGKIDVRDYIS